MNPKEASLSYFATRKLQENAQHVCGPSRKINDFFVSPSEKWTRKNNDYRLSDILKILNMYYSD